MNNKLAYDFIRNMFSESELVDSKGLLDWGRISEAMAAFAESIVEQCCKDVCSHCDDKRFPRAQLFGSVWGHAAGDNYTICRAAPIRSRWQRGEGQ